MKEEPYEILNAIYETESHILNQIETLRCMLRGHTTKEGAKKEKATGGFISPDMKINMPDVQPIPAIVLKIPLRDFFAGCALIAGGAFAGGRGEGVPPTAGACYSTADAMLKARGGE